jgi:hypothetical protein
MKVPVAYFIFNRPELVKRTFQAIRDYRPKELFIISDAPRENVASDKLNNDNCKLIVSAIDWECKVHYNYSSENMGCGRRVSSGIDWVFDNVDKAIILEDDCLVSQGFFSFCEASLYKYENQDHILCISGTNLFDFNGGDPYLSKLFSVWGWATWKRSWKSYSYELEYWPEYKKSPKWKNTWSSYGIRKYFEEVMKSMEKGMVDTWDYQFSETLWREGGACLYPGINLVSNIGFGPDATHTRDVDSEFSSLSLNKTFNTNKLITIKNLKSLSQEEDERFFEICYTDCNRIGSTFIYYYYNKIERFLKKYI